MAEHSNSQDTPTKERPAPAPAGPAEFPNIQAGRYRYIKVVGSGGAGTVYEAHDTALDKAVAIKKLHDSASQAEAIRFQREARLVGALKHDNVMSALDFGITDRNEPYLILDYVNGESLRQLLKRTGPLSGTEALEIFIQTAKGLAHAHKNNILHRDIKPSNVMLVYEKNKDENAIRVAKIVDFGLAKDIGDDQSLTVTGVGFGTPFYMSPEQTNGREVDQRSDIYSFGCLMYEVLTGQPPFRGETHIETANLHATEPIPEMSSHGIECSELLESYVGRCLCKNPGDRYQTFEDLLADLREEWESAKEAEEQRAQEEESDEEADSEKLAPDRSTWKKFKYLWMTLLVSSLVLVIWNVVSHILFPPPQDPRAFPKTGNVVSEMREEFLSAGTVGIQRPDIDGTKSYIAFGPSEQALISWLKKVRPEVDELVVNEVTFKKKGFGLLAKTNLKALAITDTPLTKELLANIALLKSLKALGIGETKILDSRSISSLSELGQLEQFEVTDVKLDNRFFEEISKLRQLRILNLRGCTGITREGMSRLKSLNQLDQLKLDQSDITDDSLAPVVDTKITRLFLQDTRVTDKGLEQLYTWRSICRLDITNTKVTNQGIQLLRQKSINPSLTVFNDEHKARNPVIE